MTSTDDVLSKIDTAWGEWLEAMDGIDEFDGTAPGVSGDYSAKDLFAHIAMWDREAVKKARSRSCGSPRRRIEVNKLNAEGFAEKADKSFAELHEEMLQTHSWMRQELAAIENLRDEWVAVDTWEHYQDHTKDLLAWRDTLKRLGG